MEQVKEWTPWEFYKIHTRPFAGKSAGLNLFFFPDPYIERILLYRSHEIKKQEKNFLFVSGQDLTIDWIEQNWIYQDLFGSDDIFYIIQPELIAQNVVDFILQLESISKTVIFSFNTEVTWANQLKKKAASSIEVRPAKFWEGNQLLELVLLYFDLELNYESQQYILESLPQETSVYIGQINLIKVKFPEKGKIVEIEDMRELVMRQKLDFFGLANFFSKKKFKQFYSEIITYDGELDDLFRFMQSHILKMYDPSYIQKKMRPTKYDKEINENSRLWSKEDLLSYLVFFGDMLLKSKNKNALLLDELRLKYLNSL